MKRLGIGLVLTAALAFGAEHEGGGSTEYWKLANFLLLAGFLGYLIYKRGGPYFRSRSEEIRRGLDDAAKIRADAETRYREMEQRLANLGADIETLRQQAREESGKEAERLSRQTEQDVRKIQAQAEHDLAAAAKAARQELRAYAAELAVGLAEQKIRQRLTPEMDRDLVSSLVNNLERQQAVRAS